MNCRTLITAVLCCAASGSWLFAQQHSPPATADAATFPGPLKVRLEGLTTDGTLRLAIFSQPDGFPRQESAAQRLSVAVTEKTTELVVQSLPVGEYAVAVYLDENGDGQLNKGSFGIPTEPYGFSNNARGRMGPPEFAEARFAFSRDHNETSVQLR